jgi:hypothetical protein
MRKKSGLTNHPSIRQRSLNENLCCERWQRRILLLDPLLAGKPQRDAEGSAATRRNS